MNIDGNETGINGVKKSSTSTPLRVAKYLLVRLLAISITIILGVFVVILVANKDGQIDQMVMSEVQDNLRQERGVYNVTLTQEAQERINQRQMELEEEAGLNLPFIPRHLRWTFNALTLRWGEVFYSQYSSIYVLKPELNEVREIVIDRFPNTLLLVGTADLVIFLVGIPLALSLSRKHGSWVDRFFSFLAPISSIPSWVFGVLLLLIFAVELRFLPFGGMFGQTPPEQKWEYIPIVARHMILPVMAILLSLLFQLVYTWRTYFMIYSDEDYVELAKAKGLSSSDIGKKHILRPSSPFIITSFSLTLVGFWQMTTALEVVFNWPGIGQLYIDSLPHFWQEQMFPGELAISVAIVVVFAYLLGMIVLVLDLTYAWLDPRVRVGTDSVSVAKSSNITGVRSSFRLNLIFTEIIIVTRSKRKGLRLPFSRRITQFTHFSLNKQQEARDLFSWEKFRKSMVSRWIKIKELLINFLSVLRELVRYPAAAASLFVILILVFGSIYALVALPYSEIGSQWYTGSIQGVTTAPKLAQPEWINLFRKDKLLSTIQQSSKDGTADKTVEVGSGETIKNNITFTFDYPYSEIPEEMYINFDTEYEVKRPFVAMTWVTPDQREIELRALSVDADKRVDVVEYLPQRLFQTKYLSLASGVNGNSEDEVPELAVLFTDASEEKFSTLQGTYQLRLDGRLFEDNADLDAELIILGQVYGIAGTDYMRRDLLVPLVWGMPFALIVGLLGATLTTIIAMLVAATGVWYGGKVDGLVQRITEVNMIFPVLALGVLFYALFDISLWTILAFVIILNIFGSPTKSFRAAFLQVKEAPYMEAAKAYGASNWRLISRYMIPRIIPVLIPQLIVLIPAFVFLEATLGMFNIHSNLPTWGRVIYESLKHGVVYGSRFWVLQPIALLLLTGFAFAVLGYTLDKILNPRLKQV